MIEFQLSQFATIAVPQRPRELVWFCVVVSITRAARLRVIVNPASLQAHFCLINLTVANIEKRNDNSSAMEIANVDIRVT